jgi:hypothetical protein
MNPPLGKSNFLADLRIQIPAGLSEGWGYVLGADVAFG